MQIVVLDVFYTPSAIRRLKKETALNVYKERASMCGVQRALGVNRHTPALWLLDLIARLPPFCTSVETAKPDDVLELDEL